jgi:hypothetical protein
MFTTVDGTGGGGGGAQPDKAANAVTTTTNRMVFPLSRILLGVRRQARGRRKVFFSEEKKQKTFTLRPWPESWVASRRKSFLVLFFKKEHSCLLKAC